MLEFIIPTIDDLPIPSEYPNMLQGKYWKVIQTCQEISPHESKTKNPNISLAGRNFTKGNFITVRDSGVT